MRHKIQGYVRYLERISATTDRIMHAWTIGQSSPGPARLRLAWTEQNLVPLVTGPATAVAGPVIAHTPA